MKINRIACDCAENTLRPWNDVRNIDLIVTNPDSDVRVSRQGADSLQQLVALHREAILPFEFL
jgi:hypothetical protein